MMHKRQVKKQKQWVVIWFKLYPDDFFQSRWFLARLSYIVNQTSWHLINDYLKPCQIRQIFVDFFFFYLVAMLMILKPCVIVHEAIQFLEVLVFLLNLQNTKQTSSGSTILSCEILFFPHY